MYKGKVTYQPNFLESENTGIKYFEMLSNDQLWNEILWNNKTMADKFVLEWYTIKDVSHQVTCV